MQMEREAVQCTAIVDWESLSSFYCELDLFGLFQGEKKKKSLLTCGLGHKLLREETPLCILLCIHDVDYIVHQIGDARIKKWRIRVLDTDRHSNADIK